MSTHDPETRERLLEAATKLFARRGFHHVTVRQICDQASANVAAINYHFGDKMGLYLEIWRDAMAAAESTLGEAPLLAADASPEERLRAHVRGFVEHLLARGQDSAVYRMMLFETAEPTPALDMVVEQGIARHFWLLAELVAAALGCSIDDPRVPRLVTDIRAICLAYLPNEVNARLRKHLPAFWSVSSEEGVIEALAQEISDLAVTLVERMR